MEINNSDYKILIVDDVKANVMLLKALVKKNDFQIIEAFDGKQALEMFEAHKPDLILLDIMMPILDGYQVLEKIRTGSINTDVSVILITALDNKEEVVKGFSAGANDYISKPFNNKELEARIRHQISLIAAKQEIDQKTKDLISAIKNRDKLYSVIAHDLRSPLSSVKMILNLLVSELKNCGISNDLYELLDESNRTTENLFILLDNLLKWTKNQIGKLHLSIQKIDIIGITHGLIGLYSLMTQGKNIEINVISNSESIEIYSDTDIFKTIIRNLLSNAIKFSYSGSKIYISIDEKNDSVEICVEDFGCGISPERQALILADKEIGYTSYGTNNEEGSGLGLNLCKEFTEKLGGKIWFESELNKGSKFYISLPKVFPSAI
ncbi:MAG: hybrid sensor histidine kinase/response regulator [Bacteroidales bacterium]|nr:hybrid sensor histidine kinase/response regulator [Bacteroidales bacterium]MDD2577709.1 hybrid sensor histidine kinase/response regulator [Bacteroidales bacterium]MDD4739754.1 hybrid sensor histidine kinase/response regulator [Bacteroidales bacterium]MEA5099640.1 hybrid sensor histidine kinase/response regulator [Bacteroidales bacterium]